MTKTNLVDYVASNTSLTKGAANEAVNAVLEGITAALKEGDKVAIPSFGTFKVRETAERTGMNPQTKEKMIIPASKTVSFSAGKGLKDAVK